MRVALCVAYVGPRLGEKADRLLRGVASNVNNGAASISSWSKSRRSPEMDISMGNILNGRGQADLLKGKSLVSASSVWWKT